MTHQLRNKWWVYRAALPQGGRDEGTLFLLGPEPSADVHCRCGSASPTSANCDSFPACSKTSPSSSEQASTVSYPTQGGKAWWHFLGIQKLLIMKIKRLHLRLGCFKISCDTGSSVNKADLEVYLSFFSANCGVFLLTLHSHLSGLLTNENMQHPLLTH